MSLRVESYYDINRDTWIVRALLYVEGSETRAAFAQDEHGIIPGELAGRMAYAMREAADEIQTNAEAEFKSILEKVRRGEG